LKPASAIGRLDSNHGKAIQPRPINASIFMPRRLSAARLECQAGFWRYAKTIFLRLDFVEIGSVESGQFVKGIHSLDVSKTRT
jgi:hypothetical protein